MVIYQRVKRAQKLGSFPLLRESTWRPSVELTDYQCMMFGKKMAESFINQNQGLRRYSDKMSAEILAKYLAIYSPVWRSLQSTKNLFEKKKKLICVRSP